MLLSQLSFDTHPQTSFESLKVTCTKKWDFVDKFIS